ncbi:hypothetical protein AGMMS49938_17460 [Fibrobacterales bacterium]|nr:hypothetical protein AGMMS49938_17460 [Fibrobacterales bacterium]
MNISTRLLYGNTISQNAPPGKIANAKINLSGSYANKPSTFTLDDDALSKHTMLIGGTGCGKTTLFYHFVSQLKKSMNKDDVMIIFDSKGDFHSKFFNKQTDLVIGNSKQYSAESVHWNIYKEILADGWEERDFIINTQQFFRIPQYIQTIFCNLNVNREIITLLFLPRQQ